MPRPGLRNLAWPGPRRLAFAPNPPLPLAQRLRTYPAMVGKSARALTATKSSSTSGVQSSSNKVPVSALKPKTCLTCGRMITPRAKWAKDWDGIKYCSDRCRSTRPGKVVATFRASAYSMQVLTQYPGAECHAGVVRVDIETFVEGALLVVAKQPGGGLLEDAQNRIRDLLVSAPIPTGADDQTRTRSNTDDDQDANACCKRQRLASRYIMESARQSSWLSRTHSKSSKTSVSRNNARVGSTSDIRHNYPSWIDRATSERQNVAYGPRFVVRKRCYTFGNKETSTESKPNSRPGSRMKLDLRKLYLRSAILLVDFPGSSRKPTSQPISSMVQPNTVPVSLLTTK